MRKVAAKRTRSEIPKFPEGLDPKPCPYCGVSVVWCRGNARLYGTKPVAVEIAPPGARGDIVIEPGLFARPHEAPTAYPTNLATRYRWHAEQCTGSFTGQARPRKTRS
jgi:hypothetical protein